MANLLHYNSSIVFSLLFFLIAGCSDRKDADSGGQLVHKDLQRMKGGGPSPLVNSPFASSGASKQVSTAQSEQKLNEILDRIHARVSIGHEPDPEDVEEIRQIIGLYDKDKMSQLSILVMCPPYVYPHLETDILKIAVPFLDGPITSANLMMAKRLVSALQSPDAGKALFSALERSPRFRFPAKIPTFYDSEFRNRGAFGELATAVVKNGDSVSMEKYCEKLSNSTNQDEQRLLLFGLRFSVQFEDFDFLLQLRRATEDPIVIRDIDIAINHIASNLQKQGSIPTNDPDYWPAKPGSLEEREANRLEYQRLSREADRLLEEHRLKDNKLLTAY
jgi:hypothetical protein